MSVFGRKNKQNVDEQSTTTATDNLSNGKSATKGRPTPSRKEAEAANRRPLVVKDRKQARKLDREQRDKIWRAQQQALRTGDERNMPVNHRGKARAFVREYIDSRYCLGELFMPAALILLVCVFIMSFWISSVAYLEKVVIAVYVYVGLVLIDSIYVAWRARSLAADKYGAEEIPPRLRFYAFTRTLYPRRWRLPVALGKRGKQK